MEPIKNSTNDLISFILKQKINPINKPKIVPNNPIRNPLIINDLTDIFTREDVKFDIFKKLVKSGSKVRSIVTKKTKDKPRSFFDNIDKWAKEQGASGLAYLLLKKRERFPQKDLLVSFFLKILSKKL